ncbi:MAG: oxidoreductase [Rhodobacteraceae bacterium]|nr:oxidoreductase [Paracoccaceae bacterium]
MKVGIIGASFARAAYLPALRHVEGAEGVALASARLDSARAAAQAHGIGAAYDDWRRMLDSHPLDLVCIATPTDTHCDMALAAIERGAAVLCEKPTAMDAAEAQRMLDAAEVAGVHHMVDHELRFNPNRRKVRELIASGALGQIRHVSMVNIADAWGDPASRAKGDWLSSASRGGGRLGALGSHLVDLARWWLGDVVAVSGQSLTMVPERICKTTGEPWTATADEFDTFSMEMENGALVTVTISAIARHGMGGMTQIFGSEGTLVLEDSTERMLFARAGEPLADIQVPDPNADLPGLNPGIWNVSVVAALRELCGAISEGRPLTEGATFRDGLRNQQILDAIRQSTRERRWIAA